MQVKPGYKRSDLGSIPEDWDAIPLGRISDCLIGLTYSPLDVRDFGTLVLRSSNIQGGRLAFDDCVYVEMEVPPRAITRKNDILICVRNGSRQLIGKCALIDESTAGSAFGAFMSVLRSESAKFLFFQFQSDILKRQINDVMGATINQITNRDMASFKVIWPPTIAEQESIAEALSDADALIESLDQLIAKKRRIKQGAMQELLTGKRRLPGFSGTWEVKRLSELADIRSGGTPSTTQPQFWDGGVMWCTPTDITALNGNKYLSNTSRTISTEGLKASSAEIIPTHSIVMTSRATIGECAINTVPMTTNQGFKNFVPFDSVDMDFLYYLLTTQRAGFIGLCSGSTFLEIGKTQLVGYQVQVPKTKSEQTAIATVLTEMDTELAALESRLAKTRQIKQGMMQELLTGRIRLL